MKVVLPSSPNDDATETCNTNIHEELTCDEEPELTSRHSGTDDENNVQNENDSAPDEQHTGNSGNFLMIGILGVCVVIVIVSMFAMMFFQSAPTTSSRNVTPHYTYNNNSSSNAANVSKNNTSTNASTSASNKNTNSSTGAASSNSTITPPVQSSAATPLSREEYGILLSESAENIASASKSGLDAALSGDVERATHSRDSIDKAYDDILALSPPEGCSEIQKKYSEAAHGAKFAASYLVGIATAVRTGDNDLAEYYANLATTELDNASVAFAEAATLIETL